MKKKINIAASILSADFSKLGKEVKEIDKAGSDMIHIDVMDGSFGVTDGCRLLEPEVIEAIEQHRFAPLRSFYWRNRALNFGSIELLIESPRQYLKYSYTNYKITYSKNRREEKKKNGYKK